MVLGLRIAGMALFLLGAAAIFLSGGSDAIREHPELWIAVGAMVLGMILSSSATLIGWILARRRPRPETDA
jgi:drug/metabolite transporter (DMT)-like permease